MSKILKISKRSKLEVSSGVLIQKIYSKYNSNYLEQLTVSAQPDYDVKNAFVFDDIDERLISNTITELSFGTNNFEIGIWVNPDTDTDQTVFEIPDCISLIYNPTGASNKFRFVLSDASTPNFDTTNTFTANNQYYVSLLRIEDNFYLSVNYRLEKTYNEASVDFQASTNKISLGNDYSTDSLNLNGYCDLLEINTESDVRYNAIGYSVGDNLGFSISRYSGNFVPQKDVLNLDASKGKFYVSGVLIDKWLNNNSRLYAYSLSGSEPDHDVTEDAIKFDHTNSEFLKIEDVEGFVDVNQGDNTLEFYMKRNVLAVAQTIMGKRAGAAADTVFLIIIGANDIVNIGLYSGASAGFSNNTFAISDTDWNHIAVVFKQAGITTTAFLFIDGVYRGIRAQNNVNDLPTKPLCLGGFFNNVGATTISQPYSGMVDKPKHTPYAKYDTTQSIGTQVFTPIPRT